MTIKPLALIIEDDVKLSNIFDQALQLADYETEVIQDGSLALERLASMIPALILLDLHLPSISGQEILREIRADGRLVKTHVVLATADQLLAKILQDDVTLTLIKPISVSQLRTLASRLHPQYRA